ncbi:ABC-type branched-chain amino acid transport system, permease component [Archaeoglobus sulfaticallidus PM70-1]|uniref:ABC-type branched-chain amino acid transport system, permease component n=1 Tax=Archaeoglobus sulfaticallidus PM70-1 TaxID=387631 RepID=N0B9I2_9EURY|nr:branched-chain amino acid ABC transporter permease [Archaeoglobus sulfaticallidus]AGK60264.1 ABC-type branched-chain amino acid transport system, permease component [Archaeoglobus sulfaticallidus PM70-1]
MEKEYFERIRLARRKSAAQAALLSLLAIALLLPFHLKWLINLAILYSILTLSWVFMERYSGRISLGHTIPFGLAGYFSAILNFYFGDFFYAGWIPGFVASSIIFFILMEKTERTGFVFITFILGVLIWIISPLITITKNGEIYGGEEGFSMIHISRDCIYLTSLLILLMLFSFMKYFEISHYGLRFKAFRDNEDSARVLGIRSHRVKAVTSLISAFFASVAGNLYVLHFNHASPELFSVHLAIFPFIATVFFREPITGAIAGSFIIVLLSDYLNSIFPQFHLMLYAIILILSPKIMNWRERFAEG